MGKPRCPLSEVNEGPKSVFDLTRKDRMDMHKSTDLPDDRDALDAVGATYAKNAPQDRVIRELIARTFEPHLNTAMRGLQLGFAEGVDTRLIAPKVARLDVVEGSRAFYEAGLRSGLANTVFHHALFETFLPALSDGAYDAVFVIYVLEHVQDPPGLLQLARRVLSPSGRLFIVVPNARALSRQLALRMGLLSSLYDLTENDLNHGHRRVYDRSSLARDIETAHLRIVEEGGIMLKILSDFQLNTLIEQGILGSGQIDGLYRLGFDYPDLCGSLYAVCEV